MYRILKLCVCACLVLVMPAAAAIDFVSVVNTVRLDGCGTTRPAERALVQQPRLDAAARLVEGGKDLLEAARASGYLARNTASIRIRNVDDREEAAWVLANRFCNIVTDAGLEDIGVYTRDDDVWMLLAKPFGAPAPEETAATVERVLQLINEARSRSRRCGRQEFAATGPLRLSAALEQAASGHARDMADNDFLGHEGSDGSMPAERVRKAGYDWRAVAENVAAGQPTADEVVSTWLASASHCAGLMSPKYTETGIAFVVDVTSEDGIYWVQVFGSRD